MANTKVQYIGDGATRDFSVPFPYIDAAHVVLRIDGTVMFNPADYSFTSPGNIQTTIAPVTDSVVEVFRVTPSDNRLVNFQNGAILTEQELDLDSEQAFYLLQENQENYSALINDALIALAEANGLIVSDPNDVLDQLIQTMIDSAAATELASRITDIDDNAAAILANSVAIVNEFDGRVVDYNDLQSQINALVAATVATVYVQASEPVPGVSGIPDPIPAGARWYDSDDNNHPYLWDDVGLVWQDLEDPRVGANEAAITALEATVNDVVTGVDATATALGVLDTTVSLINDEVVANAADIVQLQADLTTAEGDIVANAGATSTLTGRVTVNEGLISTNASDITTLDGRITTNEGDITADGLAISALAVRVTDNEGDILSSAADIVALQATVNDGLTGVVATASAVSALDVRVSSAEGTIVSEASLVDTLQSEMITAQGDINTAEITILAHTSAIGTAEGDITALEARYGIALDVNGYVSGFSLNNSGTVSSMTILADEFSIVEGAGGGETGIIPFSVSGGVVTMQNVVIDGDLVVAGTITNAEIADLTVRTEELAANSVTDIVWIRTTSTIACTRTYLAATTVQSAAITVAAGNDVLVMGKCHLSANWTGAAPGGQKFNWEIKRGTTSIGFFNYAGMVAFGRQVGSPYTLYASTFHLTRGVDFYVDTPGSGTFTYNIVVNALENPAVATTLSANDRALFLMEVKK